MEVVDQLPMLQKYRIIGTDERFNSLQEAAIKLGKVTLNEEYSGRDLRKPYEIYKDRVENVLWEGEIVSRPTLFKEVECIHSQLSENMLALVKVSGNARSIKLNKLGSLLYNAIYSFIADNWDSSKIHLMSHSSGYDSRTVSVVLKKLREEKGADWLGQMYFVCWEPEIEDFKAIMNHQGWPEDNIIVVKPGVTVDYYKDFLAFDYVGEHYSEADRFLPQEDNFNVVAQNLCGPEELQIVTGNHCDEVMDLNWVNYGHYFLRNLSDTSSYRNIYYSYLTPYTSHNVLSILLKYNIGRPTRVPTKLEIIRHVDPKLAEFKNFTPQKYRKKHQIGCELLSDSTVIKMEEDFKNSWYFKTKEPKINFPFKRKIVYSGVGTKQYIRAAICEYLLKNGVVIE